MGEISEQAAHFCGDVNNDIMMGRNEEFTCKTLWKIPSKARDVDPLESGAP